MAVSLPIFGINLMEQEEVIFVLLDGQEILVSKALYVQCGGVWGTAYSSP